MGVIEYFYSAHSAFAYLGSARLMEIAKAHGRTLQHRPMDLRRVIAENGPGSFNVRGRPHIDYFFGREIERWAEHRNVPIALGLPANHGHDITLCNCFLIAAERQGRSIDEFAHVMMQGHWCDSADLAEPTILAAMARNLDFDPDVLLAQARSETVLQIYEANTKEAIERSVFGSPTYFVDGDMFYGQDHLEMVEQALSKPYAKLWPKYPG